MEKQHLKRLGYGFSALVMAFSAVAFYPTSNTYAATGDSAVATVSERGVYVELVHVVKLGTTIDIDDASIVRHPEGWTVTAERTGSSSSSLPTGAMTTNQADGTITATAKGWSTYAYSVSKDGETPVNATVTFYVYDDVENPVAYRKLGFNGGIAGLQWVYQNKKNPDSTVVYSSAEEGVVVEQNGQFFVDTTKTGTKTITVTEVLDTVAGKYYLAPTTVTVVVYGVEFPESFDLYEGTSRNFYFESENATIVNSNTFGNDKLDGNNILGGYNFVSKGTGDYFVGSHTVTFSVIYKNNEGAQIDTVDTIEKTVNVHEKMAVVEVEGDIDATDEHDIASAALTYDASDSDIVVSGIDGLFTYEVEEQYGKYYYMLKPVAGIASGSYKVTFTQNIKGTDLTHSEEVTIRVTGGTTTTTPSDDDDNTNGSTGSNGGVAGGHIFGKGKGPKAPKAPDTGANTVAETASATASSKGLAEAAATAIAATTLAGAALFAKRK